MQEIKWIAPEFEYYKKNANWYFWLIFIAVILIIFSLWQKNLLFAVFIVVAAFLIINWGKQRPRDVHCGIDEKGIYVGQKFYSYDTFENFSLGDNEIVLKKKYKFGSYLKINIIESKGAEIKNHLLDFLPETEYNNSLIDVLAKWLKF